MRRFLLMAATAVAVLITAACGSGSGKSAEPPATIVATPGDGTITITWPMASGVEYWMFYAPSASISTSNWTTILGSSSVIGAASPYVVTGVANGTLYSFVINGRTNGGPGGPDSPMVSAIPRLAGTATATLPAPWTAAVALGANDLRGMALGGVIIAVGANGAMYSSVDGVTWNPVTSGVAGNLNAAVYAGTVYAVVGDGGVMLYSPDAVTWTPQITGTANNLYAIERSGSLLVAVGAKGTIVTSTDGKTWAAAANSGTSNDLYAVKYLPNGMWIALGAKGTLLTSFDASTWTAAVSNTALDLTCFAYGVNATNNTAIFLAVGASGALITSLDLVTWTAQPVISASNLSAVVYGTQFIAVGSGGTILTSTDGTTWTAQPSTTTRNLNAIVHAPYSYAAVGAAGVNLLAK